MTWELEMIGHCLVTVDSPGGLPGFVQNGNIHVHAVLWHSQANENDLVALILAHLYDITEIRWSFILSVKIVTNVDLLHVRQVC